MSAGGGDEGNIHRSAAQHEIVKFIVVWYNTILCSRSHGIAVQRRVEHFTSKDVPSLDHSGAHTAHS